MHKRPYLAGVLSLIVPGLGQVYAGLSGRGAAILMGVLIVGNLNAIWLSLYGLTEPIPGAIWAYELPRILHDVFAFYGVVFWIWQVVDAYSCIQRSKKRLSTKTEVQK